MMKRLFLILGIMAFAGAALAASSGFNFAYPYYAAVFTNVDSVDFFTSASGSAGTLSDNSNYYEASAAGIAACLEDKAGSLPTSYQINGSGGSAPTITCDFYPNAVANNSSFRVGGYTSLSPAASSDEDATDGELLVITNSSTFSVSASSTDSIPTGITPKVFAGYQASDKAVYKSGGNSASAKNLAGFSANQSEAFNTEYSFAKIIPLVFYAEVDVFSTAYQDPSSPVTYTVTWNASAP